MNSRILPVVCISLAVIAAATAAVIVSVSRSNAAQAYAEAEAAASDKAAAEAKKAAKEAETEAAKCRTAEANEKAQADAKAAQTLAQETAEKESRTAADKRAAAEEAAKAEREKADAARAARDEARAKEAQAKAEAMKAKEQAAVEQAKADAEVAKLDAEKLRAEKVIAEAELSKRDYDALLQWKQELDDREFAVAERERAMNPEKTIAELAWAGGMEDTIIDANGNVTKQVKRKYDPENDVTLPVPTRLLAKADRENRERWMQYSKENRDSTVSALENMYVEALKDNRIVDADFYRKSILAMYPDWKFGGEKPKAEDEGKPNGQGMREKEAL